MMDSRDERIANLASTLKASGLAKSEVQARMMAEEMIGVEENVQKRYDEEHERAHEFLKTAKNLGEPRVRPSTAQQGKEPQPSKIIEPLKLNQNDKPQVSSADIESNAQKKNIVLEEVHTDVNIGSGSLKDLMLNQIKEDKHDVKNIEELRIEHPAAAIDTVAINPATETSEEDRSDDAPAEKATREDIHIDGEKLRQLMEEDGPLEEHTREIKEKPKEVKPKEEYVENSVDLSSMFNVNKK